MPQAVAANNSLFLAFVQSPILMANNAVKTQIKMSLVFGDFTTYKVTTAPISNTAAKHVLSHATNVARVFSEEYPNTPSADLLCIHISDRLSEKWCLLSSRRCSPDDHLRMQLADRVGHGAGPPQDRLRHRRCSSYSHQGLGNYRLSGHC